MDFKVLGCSGGISINRNTTAFLINQNILIDAGSGLANLSYEEMLSVEHIFISHSHLDHIAFLPFLLNTIAYNNKKSVKVYGRAETIEALKMHIFNNVIWPDFSLIPTPESPILQFVEINEKFPVIVDGVNVIPFSVSHTVPSMGYWFGAIESDNAGFVAFSADTGPGSNIWQQLNSLPPVKDIIIDNQYLNRDSSLSQLAQHYHAAALKKDIASLQYIPRLLISHLPVEHADEVFKECSEILNEWEILRLREGETLSY